MQTLTLKGFRLSFQQERLWRWSQKDQMYRSQCAIQLEGALDLIQFRRALQQVVDAYEILHTTFYTTPGMELPMQVLSNSSTVSCLFVNIEYLEQAKQHIALAEQWQELQRRSFDLEHGSPLQAVLVRTSAQSHRLLLSLPAVCADSVTLQRLIPLLLQTYDACLHGQTYLLDEDELQYLDVSSWQYELLQGEDVEQQQEFWHKVKLSRLADIPLPFRSNRMSSQQSERISKPLTVLPEQVEVMLNTRLQRQFIELSQRYQVSTEACLLACWQILLWRLTEEAPFIGLVCDGRPYEELAMVLGPNAWTVPFDLGTPFSHDVSIEWVLQQTQQVLLKAVEKQLYFNWETLAPERSLAQQIFPISFAFTSWPDQWQTSTLVARLQHLSSWNEPIQVQLQATQIGNQLRLQLLYQPGSFFRAEIQHLATLFQTLVGAIIASPQAHVGSLALLSEPEQALQSLRWHGPQHDWPFLPLHQRFQLHAHHQPSAPALRCGDVLLSYQQLEDTANQLAHLLLAHGLLPGQRVALYQHRDQWAIICLLAVLKAGGCYAPVDEDLPPTRVHLLLQQLAPVTLICSQALQASLPDCSFPILLVESLPSLLASLPTSAPQVTILPEHEASLISTSGSTGTPKGVQISQLSISNYTQALCELLDLPTGWHFATVSSLAADLGNTSIFCALASGGCLHLLPYSLVTDGAAFASYVARFPLDVLKIVPTHLHALLSSGATGILPRQRLILGGEALPWALVELLQQSHDLPPCCQLYNHYGPTETTIGALVHPLGPLAQIRVPDPQGRAYSVPIGRPIANLRVAIWDAEHHPVPQGIKGELFLAGAGVALGYLGAPELTAQRFLHVQGARWYRTGDIVRENEQGLIEFVGRRDTQVKLRGYRIELGEIEAQLRRHPDVRETVVQLRNDGPDGEAYLVGYIVPWKHPGPDQQTIREDLAHCLPSYLVPKRIVCLEQFPLSANGKLDRRRLPSPPPESAEQMRQEPIEEPRTPIEALIQQIWRQVLQVHEIGRSDDFFRLGGHSLLGTRMIAHVRSAFGVEVPITWLFEAPTIAGLAQRIDEAIRQGHGLAFPALLPAARDQILPLSFAQQRLWFLDQLEPGSTAYTIPRMLRLHGTLDHHALEQALHRVIERHENLRTTFPSEHGEPRQEIHPHALTSLRHLDLRHLAAAAREEQASSLAQQEVARPFDLARGPLLRVWLLHLTQEEYVLLLTMHHIISDGWSSGLLVQELTTLYAGLQQGTPVELPVLPVQYADYALWQRTWLQGAILERQLDYWKTQLAGLSPLDLPTDHPRTAIAASRGAQQRVQLPQELSQQLQALSQREGVTLFMTLLAAFQVLLTRYSGQSDIAVGTPIANRTHQEIEGLIGFFINMLVLRSDLSDNPTFRDLLTRVRSAALGAYAHQDVPFEQVVEAVPAPRERNRSPLFQVVFALQNAPEAAAEQVAMQIGSNVTELHTAKFELSLMMAESEQGLQATLEYTTDLFEDATIARWLSHWQQLLEGIVANPEQHILTLPLLTAAERTQMLAEWNTTQTATLKEHCLHQLFEEQVMRTPETVALIFEECQLTYMELERQANQLAHYLRAQGVGPDMLVGLYVERSLEMIVGLLGILKAGGAYVPLDPTYPTDRLNFMLQDTHMSFVLTCQHLRKQLPAEQMALICLDSDWSTIAQQPTEKPVYVTRPQHLAYVIYTSGSTGKPKGVLVQHQSVCAILTTSLQICEIKQQDRIAQCVSFSFDVAVLEIFLALLSGSILNLVSAEVVSEGEALASLILRQAITTLCVTPSHLEMLSTTEFPNLQTLLVGGETCPVQTLAHWAHGRRFLTVYGPTEASIQATWLQRTPPYLSGSPIGRPLPNVQIYLLDAYLQPVPIGVPGELHIGGVGVVRGYLHRPDLTAERFIPDPFSAIHGQRLYATGDLARYGIDGTIEFLGRLDGQVKLRGHRIELGEIEAMLDQHPLVRQSIVALRGTALQEQQLVAYVVPREGEQASKISPNALRSYLKGNLPDYMLPTHFMHIATLPLTLNGKVDRQALFALNWQEVQELASSDNRHLNPLEDLVAQVWQQVLGKEQITGNDDFFEIGGHSLLATQVVARLRDLLNIEIPLRTLFEAPTLSGLTMHLHQQLLQSQGQNIPAILPIARDQELPLSFAQQRLWFLHQLTPQSAAYTVPLVVRLQGDLDTGALHQSFLALHQRHETLRTTFTERAGQVFQHIGKETVISFTLVDLSSCRKQYAEEQIRLLVQEALEKPFDLAHGPLLRNCLLRLSEQEHVLLLTMHHIVSDGWSMSVLIRELTALYQSFIIGDPSPLTPLPIQYADYAYWQRQWLQGDVLKEEIRYWTNQLSGARAIELSTDYPRPQVPSQRGARYDFRWDAELAQGLRQLSRQESVTLFMTLLAAFQVLLYRLTGEEDIVVGTDSANRAHLETEGLIGFFINLLALRTTFHENHSFLNVLQKVREMILGAYAHQELPFEMIAEHLRLERQRNRTPLINVLFVMQNVPMVEAELPDLALRLVAHEATHAKFDLAFFVAENTQGLFGSVTYSTDLFKHDTMVTLVQRYEALLRSIVARPDTKVASLEIATTNEKMQKASQQATLRQNLKVSRGERQRISGEDGNRLLENLE